MLKQKIGLITLLAGLSTGSLLADNTLTNFTTGDVLICFRNGGQDLVVDAGPVSTFLGYPQGSTNAITAFTAGQLGVVGVNAASWQVFAWKNDNSLYVTSPRNAGIDNQTAPYHNQTSVQQSQIIGRMANVPSGASFSYLPPNTYDPGNSTPAAVIEQDDSSGYLSGQSYHDAYAGAYKSLWNGLFQGNPENKLAGNFTTAGKVARSDFYLLTPSGSPTDATFLGYFELKPNGSMTYVAYPATRPTLQSFTRSGGSITITYSAGLYGTYTLLGSASLTSPSWTAVGTLSGGDLAIHTTNFTDTASARFYKIKGQ